MRAGITAKIAAWVLLMALPIPLVALAVSAAIDNRLESQAARNLDNLAEIEVNRIVESLTAVERAAESLASDGELILMLDRDDTAPVSLVTNVVNRIGTSSGLVGSTFASISLRLRSGEAAAPNLPGQHAELTRLALDAMEHRRTSFGPAIRSQNGDGAILLATPITAADGAMLGALTFEARLAPIADPVLRYEDLGDSSEAILTQNTSEGRVQLITLRRFDRDSAFEWLPELAPQRSAIDLDAGPDRVWRTNDYRGIETFAATRSIDMIGWGLTMKMDVGEALGISTTVRRLAVGTGILLTLVLFAGWLGFLRPLARRIGGTAKAAETVAAGRYDAPIGDSSPDEIGEVSRSIDRLASDLAADIEAREAVEARLRFHAEHDDLTGLLNRMALMRWLNDRQVAGEAFSIFFVDIDNFKELNDSMGHPAGDQALQMIARRLEEAALRGAKVARWGGDEFLIASLGDHAHEQDALAHRLANVFAEPFTVGSQGHHLRGSIGRSDAEKGVSIDEIIRRADENMFEHKNPDRRRRFVPQSTRSLVESALEEDRVQAHFQPFVEVVSSQHQLIGAEALVRIEATDGGLISPSEFLPDVAGTPLGAAIDERVMGQAVAALERWDFDGLMADRDLFVSVNIGEALLADPPRLDALLTSFGPRLKPGTIFIELPETAAHVDGRIVTLMHSLGIRVAIDDVGSQYSGLERMDDLSADLAKIDRRWVHDVGRDHERLEVTRTLIRQCEVFGLDVLAEGVETAAELAALRTLGVTKFQGFYFGRPTDERTFVERYLPRTNQRTALAT